MDKDFERYCELREKFLLCAQKGINEVSAATYAQAAGLFAIAAELRAIGLDGITLQGVK